MSGTAWHARVECGTEVGAGFLVSGRHVLTCAHVVRRWELAPVVVSFPGHRELTGIPATVAVHGGWQGRATDPGDLAVLELDREVPLAPADFASPGDEREHAELIAYGFPKGYDEGMLASYRALPGPLISDEWAQLEALTAHGQPLAGGFSGAAVTLADGRVVGMVSAVAGGPDTRVGRMLPTRVLVRYWPELCERIPDSDHRPEALRRLYALVERAVAEGLDCSPDGLYLDAVGRFGPPLPKGGFASLSAAAGYVQWEVPDAVTAFGGRLRELLEAASAPPAPPAVAPAWSPILVEIEHSGAGADQVTVEVSAYRDGHRRRVDSRRLPRSAVREYVQRRVDEAFEQLAPDAEQLVTFVLPREWLNEPVAHWECGPEDSTPLGCAHPLVVVDRSRYRSGRLRHQLAKKWQKLDAGTAARLHRVDCGGRERPPGLRKRLRDDDADLAGFSYPPGVARPHFEAGLNTPVPVLLWPRTGCAEPGHEGPCVGTAFLDELAASVTGVPPAELPRRVMELRETADADDDPDGHWAKDVQLLWDDPRCFPQPAASLHSPVH
ncbi:serine protease [Streptomyces cinnabarinus]|uniref:Serine protease n=1 Tax=Streptomyces cinnabarinus TaxID=67287 RepID=A0ABY7KAY6_9ACTN|nr:trypsin-like peptidase domain-containing protein [Streptomyces cinnabarinus]WAZ21534.1 serine protease [Streptomyces cinnabarinus]